MFLGHNNKSREGPSWIAELTPQHHQCPKSLLSASHVIFMKEMATYSSIFAWKIPWMEKPVGLQSMGSQRVRHARAHAHAHTHTCTRTHTHTHTHTPSFHPLSFVHPVKMAATTPASCFSSGGCYELCLAPPSGWEEKCRFLQPSWPGPASA